MSITRGNLLSLTMPAPLNVLIYSGHGTCEFSVSQTFKTLKRFLKSSYDLKLTGLDTLRNERIPWDETCALFVMPGGRDSKYLESFKNTRIVVRISKGVRSGKMKYLGLCAGAYFAADRIEFEMGRDGYEIVGDRPLKLIDTPAIGTLKTTKLFTYENKDIEAVDIKTDSKYFKAAYTGGCYFPDAKSDLIFARYANSRPAILLSPDFCLSGVHFEYNAEDCSNVELRPFEKERIELVRTILTKLGLQVSDTEIEQDDDEVIYISNDKADLSRFVNNKSVKIISKSLDSIKLPEKFFLLHSRICSSTQTILTNEPALLDRLPNFSVYVADHQVKGKGRVNNCWISSEACLQFTLKIEWPLAKGNRLPLLQFLIAVTLVETINSFKFVDCGVMSKIKWPNDVYLVKEGGLVGKISGILVNCIQSCNVYNVLIGVGVNLLSDQLLPSIVHLNDHLTSSISKEEFLVKLLERFHYRYTDFISSDSFPFDDYHRNWLHSNQQVQLESVQSRKVSIKSIDEFGYLVGKDCATGEVFKIEPDGNSFDMMHNLIKRKQ